MINISQHINNEATYSPENKNDDYKDLIYIHINAEKKFV